MSFEGVADLNWLAVLVGAGIYYMMGPLWFGILFSKPWQRSVGLDPSEGPPQMNPLTYGVPLVALLIMAAVVGWLAASTGSTDLTGGVILGLALGIGLAVTQSVIDAAFDPAKPQPWMWAAINGGYHATGLLIVAVLVSIWR